MATLEEVRWELDKDELSYPALAAQFGADVLPQLRELVAEDEPRIASKAAYLAGLIHSPGADDVVLLAANSRHDVVRVSAAAAVAVMMPASALPIATKLLADVDPGVRIRAVKSAVNLNAPDLSAKVRRMQLDDPDEAVRSVAQKFSSAPSQYPPVRRQHS
jgi:HEAT repeat protein